MIPSTIEYVVGTGGIGSGILFKLAGDHSLGRNESRLAELTDYKDYCKLHIIFSYVAAFAEGSIPIYAIGGVGDDPVGEGLLKQMQQSGINIEYVDVDMQNRTMYAVCYQYPNGEGGNITAQNSASDCVSAQNVDCFLESVNPTGNGIVLAAPEVPVETRLYLLKKGRELGCYNVASLVSSEIEQFAENDAFGLMDLISINQDEAEAIANLYTGTEDSIIDRCYNYLKSFNPGICVIITCGGDGIYAYLDGTKHFVPAVKNTVLSTAGAGDCFLGTVISALIRQIPLVSEENETAISSALQLAAYSASMKIACNDTIDFSINRQYLFDFIQSRGATISDNIKEHFFQM